MVAVDALQTGRLPERREEDLDVAMALVQLGPHPQKPANRMSGYESRETQPPRPCRAPATAFRSRRGARSAPRPSALRNPIRPTGTPFTWSRYPCGRTCQTICGSEAPRLVIGIVTSDLAGIRT